MENRPNPTGKTTMAVANLVEFLNMEKKKAVYWVHDNNMVKYVMNLVTTMLDTYNTPYKVSLERQISLQNGSTIEIRPMTGIHTKTAFIQANRGYDISHIDHHALTTMHLT